MSTYKKIFSLALLLSVLAFANTRMYAYKGCDSDRCSTSRSGDCDTDCDRSRDCDEGCDTFSRGGDCSTDCFRNGQRGRAFINRHLESFNSLWDLTLINYHVYHSNSYCGPRSTIGFYVTPFYKEATRRDRHHNLLKSGFSRDGDFDRDNTRDFGNRRPRHGLDQRIYGAVFTIYADLGGLLCDGFWGSVNFAAVNVERRLCRLKDKDGHYRKDETVVTANTLENGCVKPCTETITECTTVEKFKNRCHEDRGVDGVQVKIGYDYFLCNNDHVGLYLVGAIPTHRRDHKDKHLFESRVGTRHGGIGAGLNTDYTLWQGCASNFNWMADVKWIYFLKENERRPLRTDTNCNVLESACVRVKPRSFVNFWTAFHYEHCCWNFELGYNLLWRDREEVCLLNNKDNKRYDTKTGTVTATCEKPLTIANNGVVTDVQQAISTNSARGESKRNAADDMRNGRRSLHSVFGALGYSTTICNYPTLLGLGGSYDFARCREDFDHWSVFGKLGIQF